MPQSEQQGPRELEGAVAVVYGGSGVVGRAVAAAFAHGGASVHLVGRSAPRLEAVAREIRAAGHHSVSVAPLDAFDADAVSAHVDNVVATDGGIDVVFNALSYRDVQGSTLADLDPTTIEHSLVAGLRGQLATTRAVAQHMTGRGRGVLLTAVGHGPPHPKMGTTAITWQLVEALVRQWAVELGPHGVRVNWLRLAGTVESIVGTPEPETSFAAGVSPDELLDGLSAATMLGHLPSAGEVGDLAAFLASDRARSLTATGINVTAGTVAD